MLLELPSIKLLISLVIGAVIGLERASYDKNQQIEKTNESPHKVGVRTFSMITSLGTLAGLVMPQYLNLFILLTSSFFILLMLFYTLHSLTTKDTGITTELAMIFAYLIGVLIALDMLPIQLIIAISVVLVLILSRKETIKEIVFGIKRHELHALISYGMIALVILPFLPNQDFSLQEIPGLSQFLSAFNVEFAKLSQLQIINPFKLWLIVALITGIDVAAYLLEKLIGAKKGRIIASIAGGIVSSTATTQSLSQESKTTKDINNLLASAVFANLASFFPIFILITSINQEFLVASLPTLIFMIVSAFLVGLFFLFQKDLYENKKEHKNQLTQTEIFSLSLATKFALLFLVIRIASQVSLLFFGQSGFLLTVSLASLTGTDAVTINISELVGSSISVKTGVIAIIAMNGVNLLGKSFYSFLQGKKEFSLKFLASVTIIIISSLLGLFFV